MRYITSVGMRPVEDMLNRRLKQIHYLDPGSLISESDGLICTVIFVIVHTTDVIEEYTGTEIGNDQFEIPYYKSILSYNYHVTPCSLHRTSHT